MKDASSPTRYGFGGSFFKSGYFLRTARSSFIKSTNVRENVQSLSIALSRFWYEPAKKKVSPKLRLIRKATVPSYILSDVDRDTCCRLAPIALQAERNCVCERV